MLLYTGSGRGEDTFHWTRSSLLCSLVWVKC